MTTSKTTLSELIGIVHTSDELHYTLCEQCWNGFWLRNPPPFYKICIPCWIAEIVERERKNKHVHASGRFRV